MAPAMRDCLIAIFLSIIVSNSAFIRKAPRSIAPYLAGKDSIAYRRSLLNAVVDNSPEIESKGKVFIFGLGYVGTDLAFELQSQGWQVSGTCTNVNKAIELKDQGINTFLFDEMTNSNGQNDCLNDLMSSTHILSTIPPIPSLDYDIVLEAYLNSIRKSVMSKTLKWVGYLSSTGVYGDCDGAWVNEETPVNPTNPKTIARANAERDWRDLYERSGLPVHVFRLAGIYGPGRSALQTLIKAQGDLTQCQADDIAYISRIHVTDISKVLTTSMQSPDPGAIYNVADDLPSTRYDVLSYSSRLLDYPLQRPFQGKGVTRGGSKRVDNSKMKRLLVKAGTDLDYPDYRSGLKSLSSTITRSNEYRDSRGPDEDLTTATVYATEAQTDSSAGTNGDSKGGSLYGEYVSKDEYNSLLSRFNAVEKQLSAMEKTQVMIKDALVELSRKE
jgi:nucleoside-diphosphate-sugar epimerase